MNLLKKILLNGLFETMIDVNLNKRVRVLTWIVVTILFALIIIAETLLIFIYDLKIWRIIISLFLVVTILFLLSLYVRLLRHLSKRKRKNKKEAIERELRIKAQMKAEERANSENIYKT